MRVTKTWTISLPPAMSELAQEFATREHRTKSELVREALRLYFGARRSTGRLSEQLKQMGDLIEVYRRRHPEKPSEAELRQTFRGVRRLHDRLQAAGYGYGRSRKRSTSRKS